MIFDDFDSWDGLSGLGAFSMIGGFGVTVYLAYAFGFQSGIGAAKPCTGNTPTCTVQTKKGWFGMDYLVVEPVANAAGAKKMAPGQDDAVIIAPTAYDPKWTYMIVQDKEGNTEIVSFPVADDCKRFSTQLNGECLPGAEAKARYGSK
jgi:hypothetical protein